MEYFAIATQWGACLSGHWVATAFACKNHSPWSIKGEVHIQGGKPRIQDVRKLINICLEDLTVFDLRYVFSFRSVSWREYLESQALYIIGSRPNGANFQGSYAPGMSWCWHVAHSRNKCETSAFVNTFGKTLYWNSTYLHVFLKCILKHMGMSFMSFGYIDQCDCAYSILSQ